MLSSGQRLGMSKLVVSVWLIRYADITLVFAIYRNYQLLTKNGHSGVLCQATECFVVTAVAVDRTQRVR